MFDADGDVFVALVRSADIACRVEPEQPGGLAELVVEPHGKQVFEAVGEGIGLWIDLPDVRGQILQLCNVLAERPGERSAEAVFGDGAGIRALVQQHDLRGAERVTADEARRLDFLAFWGWEPTLNLVVDTAFPRGLLLKIVSELRQLCPKTQLQLSDAVLSGADDAILCGNADVVVTTHVPSGFVGDPLIDVTFTAVAAPGHPLFQIDLPLTTEHLFEHMQCVVHDSGTKHPRDDGWLGAGTRCTVSSLEASLAVVEAGLAYAWLPEHLVEESLRRSALRRLPLTAGASRKISLSLVLVRPESAGPAARAAVECFQRHVPAPPRHTPEWRSAEQ